MITCTLTLIDSICPNSSNKLVKSCCVAFLSTWPTQRVVLQTAKRSIHVTTSTKMFAYRTHYRIDIIDTEITDQKQE